jgi:O-antigen ligase
MFAMLWALWNPVSASTVLTGSMAQRASDLRPVVQLLTTMLSVAVFPIVVLSLESEQRLTVVVKTWLIVTALIALYGIYQSFAVAFGLPLEDITWGVSLNGSAITKYGQTRYYAGLVTNFAPRATFAESLHFGAYLAGVFPFCLACWLGRATLPERWRRWPWRSLSLLLGLVLLLTFSRSSWVAGAFGVLVVLFFARRVRVWLLCLAGLVVASLAFSALSYLPIFDATLSGFELISGRLSPGYLVSDPRVLYFGVLADLAGSHPIWGVGLGNYAMLGASELGINVLLSAHSVWAAHWVEGGLIGLAVLIGLFVTVGKQLVRHLRTARTTVWFFPLVGLIAGIAAMSAQYLTWGDRFDDLQTSLGRPIEPRRKTEHHKSNHRLSVGNLRAQSR